MRYADMRNRVRDVYKHARGAPELQSISSEILDIMKDSALEAIDKMELTEQNGYPVDSGITTNYPHPTVDKYLYEKDRK